MHCCHTTASTPPAPSLSYEPTSEGCNLIVTIALSAIGVFAAVILLPHPLGACVGALISLYAISRLLPSERDRNDLSLCLSLCQLFSRCTENASEPRRAYVRRTLDRISSPISRRWNNRDPGLPPTLGQRTGTPRESC